MKRAFSAFVGNTATAIFPQVRSFMQSSRFFPLLALVVLFLLIPSTPLHAATCAAAWSSSAVYTGGMQASYNGTNYQAAYWTQGNNPSTSSGPVGSGQPWIPEGSCSGGGGGATPTPTQSSGGCTPTTITPYIQVNGGSWMQTSSTSVNSGDSVKFGPQPVTGGSWSWSGPNGYSASSREITVTFSSSGTYTATYTNPSGCKSTQTFTVSVNGSGGCTPTSITPYVQVNGGSWQQTSSVSVSAGSSVKFGPQPVTGGSWSWSGSGLSSSSREVTVNPSSSSSYTATYTNPSGCQSSQTFNVTVTSGGCGSNCGGGSTRFAPYADISLASGENIVSNASAAGLKSVTLAFLVDGGCVATWGGLGGTVSGANFPNGTSVSSQINQLISNGVSVIISWGGANGSIASSCSSASSIQSMYQSVFNAYPGIAGQDFDIEGGINTSAVAQALAGLKNANPGKSISLTLPVLPSGLVSAGMSIVNACHSAGFNPDTVNVMAMDYGSSQDNGGQMGLDATDAASSTRSQTGNNIGVTPMIGVNDTNTEVFQLSDAQTLVNFAHSNGYINRLAMWSLGRDNGGCAGSGFASATCSSISQSNFQFSSIFNGF